MKLNVIMEDNLKGYLERAKESISCMLDDTYYAKLYNELAKLLVSMEQSRYRITKGRRGTIVAAFNIVEDDIIALRDDDLEIPTRSQKFDYNMDLGGMRMILDCI